MAVKPIPDMYHSVQPYLVVDGAAELIEFLKGTFDVESRGVMPRPDGRVGHAEVVLGDSVIMLADAGGPTDAKATSTMLVVYVEDVDKHYQRALEAGGCRRPRFRLWSAVAVPPLGAVRHRQRREGPDPRRAPASREGPARSPHELGEEQRRPDDREQRQRLRHAPVEQPRRGERDR